MMILFQSTHPHGVRLNRSHMGTRYSESFNPRTHTGYDPPDLKLRLDEVSVSIHAPTRGTTLAKQSPWVSIKVSIHAPTRGTTNSNFNYNAKKLVSIHAPTRGTTDLSDADKILKTSFNPRTHTGYDTGVMSRMCCQLPGFQSTHPHGVRPDRFIRDPRHICFNPRTHTGYDTVGRLL